ncbi:bile acid:sodium symporter family protein [Christiangramia sabulilitoris]|uniref:Bile acid:sodium symporter family protein n=1 Tax=Christiangramia sabulilitoris TaxID=2583991 RepID=A0A550I829_9FLAO|nr:bile acid:sodium symporter [Christiangramia sabulilitoris]TRO67133.1 bile acid:sodium symporter family protein [Christiangramia sabulilitoris]
MENPADYIMPAAIALIMFGIGIELKFKDFRLVFLYPRAVITGLISQLIILPAIAFGLIYFWPVEPLYKIGFMLIAACPGGTASNLVTKILKGKVALSISLTAFNSFLILFSLPLILEFSFLIFEQEAQSFDLSFWETMKQVSFTVVLPVLAGIGVNSLLNEKQLENIHQPLKFILPALLIVSVMVVMFSDDSEFNIDYLNYLHLFIPLVILNMVTILAGFLIGKFSGLKHATSYTIAVEMGLQNSVLALFVANQLMQSKEISLIAILYGSFSLITTFGLAYMLKKHWKYAQQKIA